MPPQLCLGTVQFGLPYGITNTTGQVAEEEVRQILQLAAQEGIELLDTAQAYGEAESVLGRTMSEGHAFRLISKLPAQSQPFFTDEDPLGWEDAFHRSCVRLGQPCLEALLLHSSADLRKPGGQHLQQWLLSLRERDLVRRLGVSIYTADDLVGVPPELMDLVQLPLSLYDQRLLADGTIAQLRTQGCEIHARSLYLQGLLLKPAAAWPVWASSESRLHHLNLEQLAADRGFSLLDCALGFARAQKDIEAVVLGLCTQRELQELFRSWERKSPWEEGELKAWILQDADIVEPRRWPV